MESIWRLHAAMMNSFLWEGFFLSLLFFVVFFLLDSFGFILVFLLIFTEWAESHSIKSTGKQFFGNANFSPLLFRNLLRKFLYFSFNETEYETLD